MITAVVFPGQGSQAAGFGLPWIDHPATAVIDRAETAVDAPLRHLLLDPDADLDRTRDAQLSVLLGSLLAWEATRPVLDRLGVTPIAHAGHSLGQITALITTGTLDLADGLELAVARADATAAAQAREPGTLLALLGADEDRARAVCTAVGDRAWPANLNGAGQVIIGTRPDDTDLVTAAAKEHGVRRIRPLPVDGAFHTPLMRPAADALAPVLDRLDYRTPTPPIVTNHDATLVEDDTGWPERLHTHLVEPVRWEDSIHRLTDLGVDRIIEIGPGSTLTGLIRRIAPDLTTHNIRTPECLENLTRSLDDLAVGMAR